LATKNSGESRQLATYSFNEKVTGKIINRMNLSNSTSGGITCLTLFPSPRLESQMRKPAQCGSKWQI